LQSNPGKQPPIPVVETLSVEPSSSADRIAIFGFLGLYAVILALVTQKHEMYMDEAQAWLVSRDHSNIFDLIHHLRYEVHPALWYLLLYIPAHLHFPMVSAQIINYALSLAAAWMILSYRRIPLIVRVLLLYGLLFFFMGVIARSYMLACVLLIGAARCLLAEHQRYWTAMVLLALAINTHLFAIPVAAGIFFWLAWFAPSESSKSAIEKLKEQKFWLSVGILGMALLACFFTIRPAPDISVPEYVIAHTTKIDYLLLGIGKMWGYFLPFRWEMLSSANQYVGASQARAEVLNALITICLLLLALSVLPGRRSRWFMISVSLLWMAAVWPSVHVPLQSHSTFIIMSYIIALMIGATDDHDGPWLADHFSWPLLLLLLCMQVSLCVTYSVQEWGRPFSGAKSAATWLQSSGLDQRPLIFQSGMPGPAILGYTGVASAYYASCRCRGSFLMFNSGWGDRRQTSAEELRAVHRQFNSAPILVSQWQIDNVTLERLGLRFLYASPKGWAWDNENVFIYDSVREPVADASE
jgi:hypothetical protein